MLARANAVSEALCESRELSGGQVNTCGRDILLEVRDR